MPRLFEPRIYSILLCTFILKSLVSVVFSQTTQQREKSQIFLSLQEKKLFLNSSSNQSQYEVIKKNLSSVLTDELFIKNSVEGLQFNLDNRSISGLKLLYSNLENSQIEKDNVKNIISLSDLSYAHFLNNQLDSSEYYSSLILPKVQRQKNHNLLLIFINFHSDILVAKNLLFEGIAKKVQLNVEANKKNNNWFIAKAYHDIAIISVLIGNNDQAQEYSKLASLHYQKINNLVGIENSKIVEELIKIKSNSRIDQPELNKIKIKLSEKKDFDVFSLWALSEFQLKLEEYNSLIKEVDFKFDLVAKHDIYKLKSNFNRILAESYLAIGDNKRALLFALKSLDNWSPNKDENNKRIQLVGEVLRNTGQVEKAIDYYHDYIEKLVDNDVYFLINRIEDRTEANLRELQRKEKEENDRKIEKQREDLEREKIEKNRLAFESERRVIIGIVSLLIAFLGVGILLLRIRVISSKKKQKEAELSQTILRSQMNPHFVFNAMSVIQSYIYSNDTEKSSTFLVNFSRLMRLILENSSKELIPLELEREILEKYIIAQKMRFQDRFEFELNFEQNLLENRAMIPPMISQPFVENSIEHGQLHNVEGGKININVFQMNETIVMEITDNGVGRKASSATKKIKGHKSMAIDITKDRLTIINKKFKGRGSIDFEDLKEEEASGTKVIIKLPLIFELWQRS